MGGVGLAPSGPVYGVRGGRPKAVGDTTLRQPKRPSAPLSARSDRCPVLYPGQNLEVRPQVGRGRGNGTGYLRVFLHTILAPLIGMSPQRSPENATSTTVPTLRRAGSASARRFPPSTYTLTVPLLMECKFACLVKLQQVQTLHGVHPELTCESAYTVASPRQ